MKQIRLRSSLFFKRKRFTAYRSVSVKFIVIFALAVITIVTTVVTVRRDASLQRGHIHVSTVDPDSLPPTLAHYLQWHTHNRRCIIDGNCDGPRPRMLVWRCLDRSIRNCAGVGDRVRGIQVALMVAIITGRLFFVEWPDDPFPFLDAIVPSAFDWRFPSELSHTDWPLLNWFLCPSNNKRYKCRPPKYLIPSDESLPNVNYSLPYMNSSTDDLRGNLSIWSDIAIACRIPATLINSFVTNPFISPKMPDLHPSRMSSVMLQRLLIKILFRPSPQVQSVINSILSPSFVKGGYIGVHARTGLDFQENDSRFILFKTNFSEAVSDLMACAKRMHPLSRKRMLIATDSVPFKLEMVRMANESGIDTRYIPSRAFHFGLEKSDKLLRLRYNDDHVRWRAYINVFADLYMLANSRAIVTTGSGFARLSYWLGNSSRLLIAAAGNGTQHCGYDSAEPPRVAD